MPKWKTKAYKKKSVRERDRLEHKVDEGTHSDLGHRCSHDGFPCKRVGYDGVPACFTYNANGRLRFVCKRFVTPAGFSLRKRFSQETLEKMKDDNYSLSDDDFLERVDTS